MKSFSLILLAGFAYFTAALDVDVEHRIAARQVNTAQLRSGTRRLTARQAQGSTVPVQVTSEYIKCPSMGANYYLTGQLAMRFASETEGQQNTVECSYQSFSAQTARCLYDADSGESERKETTSSLYTCPDNVEIGPLAGDLCYTGCPRRMNGYWFANAQLANQNQEPSLMCNYSEEPFGSTDTKNCRYLATTGLLAFSPTDFACSAKIPISNYCADSIRIL